MPRWRPAAMPLRWAFITASVVWAVLLVAAPYAASRGHATVLSTALIAGVYGIGSLICHQLPERSYALWHAQMPVCARCTGIYAGAVIGAVTRALRTAKAVRLERLRTAEAVRHERLRTAEAVRHETADVVRHECASVAHDRRPVAHGFSRASTVRLILALAVAPTLVTLAYEWTTGI